MLSMRFHSFIPINVTSKTSVHPTVPRSSAFDTIVVFLLQSRKKKRLTERHRMALYLQTERPPRTSPSPRAWTAPPGSRNDLAPWATASSPGGCSVTTASTVSPPLPFPVLHF